MDTAKTFGVSNFVSPSQRPHRASSTSVWQRRAPAFPALIADHCVLAEQSAHGDAAAEKRRQSTENRENHMAKGQARSNREIRKPKKDKTTAPVAAVQGTQVKFANSGLSLGKKQK
ncbi:hypothetical protein [Ensifer sp. BR816]|uniref:hypothetical protein n=1 Tax=Rhizobium sp. (strain BR816) TaxID=1057002 RepID=UPI0012FC88E5|nr:hypothetical protein [Ensifer sp. BR816]